jgi:predicted transposase YbfD/YdcC
MNQNEIPPLMDYFKGVEDPRIERQKLYPLVEVLVIALLAFMSQAEGWEDIEDYGKSKEAWLRKFLKLEAGIPHHDVYRRVFARLKPEQIEGCFMDWAAAMRVPIDREVIAIDGKTIRGSANKQGGLKAAHMVSAYATEQRLVFAQVKTAEKQNEITAIPELLALFALKGGIVTIDAMGCQYKIADQIVEAGADYLFSLKENQESLYEDVKEYFTGLDFEHPDEAVKVHQTFAVDHGRQERRKHGITSDVQWLRERHPAWRTIQSIGVIEGRREIGEAVSIEKRYYVSSLTADAAVFAFAARAHWGIENSLHYVLDVAFREDACRIKSGSAPENLAVIRKIALTLVRRDVGSKQSIKKRLKRLAWSDDYFEQLLFLSPVVSPE